MIKDDIDKVLEHFTIFYTKDYIDTWMGGQQEEIVGMMYHNDVDYFYLVIFKSGEVYQLNSDHERQGVELDTIEDLKIRFKSFTGESLNL